MILSNLELKLKQANPKLHIKRYGSSMAAVHYGSRHVCRVPVGEITMYNVTREEVGYSDQFVTQLNLNGEYRWNRLLRRGRGEMAHMLQIAGLINAHDAAKIRN